MTTESIQQLTGDFQVSINLIWARIIAFLPKIGGAILIVIAGWVLGFVVRKLLSGVLGRVGLDKLVAKLKIDRFLERIGSSLSASEIIGRVAFWVIFLIALMAAVETIGLTQASESIDQLVQYLPKVVAAILLLLFGFVVAGFLQKAVSRAAASMGIDYARAIGQLVYWFIAVVSITLAIGQLGLETTLINRIVVVVLAATGATLALALGLGMRIVSRNVVSGVYARDLFKPGMWLEIDGMEAKVIGVGSTTTCLEKKNGKLRFVPNSQLIERTVDEASSGSPPEGGEGGGSGQ